MSVTEDVARLILETNDVEFAAASGNIQKSLGKTKADVYELADAYDLVDVEVRKTTVSQTSARTALGATTVAIEKQTKAVVESTNKMKGLGQTGLQTGRIIQDFAQGGIGGILNNVEGLAMALGGGPGLAGLLTGVGVALFLLKEPIKDFFASFSGPEAQGVKDVLEEIKQRIKDIEKQPVKLSVDVRELEEAKKRIKELETAQKAFDAMREGMSVEEKEAGQEVKKLLTDQGDKVAAAAGEMKAQMVRELVSKSETIKAADAEAERSQKKIEALEERLKQGMTEEETQATLFNLEREKNRIKDAQQRAQDARTAIDKEAEKKIGALQVGAEAGNRPDDQQELAQRLAAAGQGGLAGQIAAITPQAIAKKKRKELKAEEDKYWEAVRVETDAAAKEVADAQHKAVKDALEPILKAGDFRNNITNAIKVAETEFGDQTPEQRYELLKGMIVGELKRRLTQKGQRTDDSADLIAAAATQLLGQGKAEKAKDEREAAAAGKAGARGAKRDAADVARAADKVGRENAAAAEGAKGLQAQAEAAIARGLAGGMQLGPDGKLAGRDFDQFVRMISAQLRRENPRGNPMAQASQAMRIAANAEQGVGAKMLEQQGMGLSEHQKTQRVLMQTQQQLAKLAADLNQVRAMNAALAQNGQRLEGQIRRPTQTNLNMGVK